jgi:hypothetical protein
MKLCQANEITLIPGFCLAQFLKPDFSHILMRRLQKVFGYLRVEAERA